MFLGKLLAITVSHSGEDSRDSPVYIECEFKSLRGFSLEAFLFKEINGKLRQNFKFKRECDITKGYEKYYNGIIRRRECRL